MQQLTRTWLGLAALGAGLIHLAVAASSTPALLAVFVLIGAAEVAWGVAALAADRLPLPRAAIGGALLPVVVWIGTLVLTPQMDMSMPMTTATAASMAPVLPTGPMLGSVVLDLLVAAGAGVVGRGAGGGQPSAQRPWRFLLGVLVGGGLVAVVTANSLAGTAVGAGGMTGMGH